MVAMITIPGNGLVEHCNLECQTSEGVGIYLSQYGVG